MRRFSSNDVHPEGALCQAAGDLIREGVEGGAPLADLEQWAVIASSLPGRRRATLARRWAWRLAGPAFALGGAAAVLWVVAPPRSPLAYVTDGCEVDGAGAVVTGERETGLITFSDGSTIALEGGTRARLVVPARAASAELVLERGAADLNVAHHRDTRWAVDAGPFRVDVKGTQFHVSWSPEPRHFKVDLRRGEVAVRGRLFSADVMLRAGEVLETIGDKVSVSTGGARMVGSTSPGPMAAGPSAEKTATAMVAKRRAPAAGQTRGAITRAEPAPDLTPAVRLGLRAVEASSSSRGMPVTIGPDGKLDGPMTGYAWVAASPRATIRVPAPCDVRGCFKDTKGQLCASGTIPALRCRAGGAASADACDWEANWGAMIGMHTSSTRGAWQSNTPWGISIAYRGGPEARDPGERGRYRLNVHVAGDPDSKLYCLDNYQSGQVADATMLRTECWTGSGQTLERFQQVDKVSLQVKSTEVPLSYETCITAVAVNGTAGEAADTSDALAGQHVAIGNDGKLGGEMTGYAWVAGGSGTSFRAPASCDQNGCFKNARGRLCADGTIAALTCTGAATPRLSCDWQTNWGAMVGFSPNLDHDAWGAGAPATVAITFSGPAAHYRLVAHVSGTPETDVFCIDDYKSGQPVAARALKSQCWSNAGKTLPGYEDVDKLGLQLVSAAGEISFELCVADIVVR